MIAPVHQLAFVIAFALVAQAWPPLHDLAAIPALPYLHAPVVTPRMTRFVAREVTSGRCPVAAPADGHYLVRLDIAVLVTPYGRIRATVPHAINCPTVEQYGAGLVTKFARGNLVVAPPAKADQWYRSTLSFDWTE